MARITRTQAFKFLESLETPLGERTEEEKIFRILFEIEMLYFKCARDAEKSEKPTIAGYYKSREDAIREFLDIHGFFKKEV